MTQIRDSKSSSVKQQEDCEEMGAYISNQVKMHAYHLNFETLDNEFCKFQMRKFQRNPSSGRPTWNGEHWNCFWKFITFENFSTWAGRPWELGHQFFPPPFSFHSWGSAFPILPPFERVFEPSSYLNSSAPSSPRLICFRARLWALDHQR